MNRRLMLATSTTTSRNRRVFDLVNQTEMWFLPVAGTRDGYDSVRPDQRLWRKNLRDNDSDGQDHERRRRRSQSQLRLQVGLRQRGLLRRRPDSETYRGPGPNSEPESKALAWLGERISLQALRRTAPQPGTCCCNHGWAVGGNIDDQLGIAMTGDDAHPGRPGL